MSVTSQRDYLGDICGERISKYYRDSNFDFHLYISRTGSHFVGG